MALSKKAWVELQEHHYLALIMFIAPMLNFLAGISFDLYAPSMPAIAQDFNTSIVSVKNTITITMVGFSLGCLILGVMIDKYGRRTILVPSLILFTLISLSATFVTNIEQLFIVRFFQGFFTAAAGIGARTIIVDYFSGKLFIIAVLYTTIAYGLGLVVGPFFGGLLQYHFGWQANFYAYALTSGLLLLLILLFMHESLQTVNEQSIFRITKIYLTIVSNKIFIAGTAILSIVLIEQLIYPTLGVFVVQDMLGYSSITYGNTALLTGLSYLTGTLINRFLLNYLSQKTLVYIGFTILFIAVICQMMLAYIVGLNLWTLLIPIIVISLGMGFLFGNILGTCLKLFPKNAAMNTAIQSFFFMLISSVGIFLINIVHINNLQIISYIFFISIVLQFIIFYFLITPVMD